MRKKLHIDLNGNATLYQQTPLNGWDILGTVRTDKTKIGALVRNKKTGLYSQANAGLLRSLPQELVQQLIKLTSQE